MLIPAQKDMLANIAQEGGVDGLKEVFTVATMFGDTDTMAHISTEYADLFSQHEQEIMLSLTGMLVDMNEAMEQEQEDFAVPEGATLH